MNYTAYSASWRCAQAYLNVFAPNYGDIDQQKIESVVSFLKTHTALWYAFAFSSHARNGDVSGEIFKKLQARFSLDDSAGALYRFLAARRKLSMFPVVLRTILLLEKRRSDKKEFIIETSHKLSGNDQKRLVSYLEDSVKSSIDPLWRVNKKLVSGFRARSDEYLLDASMSRYLERLEQEVIRLGGLC